MKMTQLTTMMGQHHDQEIFHRMTKIQECEAEEVKIQTLDLAILTMDMDIAVIDGDGNIATILTLQAQTTPQSQAQINHRLWP